MSKTVTVVGAGLAGCEAAWALANRGVPVRLVEMKPEHKTPAHHSDDFGELVCSNSLKATRIDSAAGLLKAEMKLLGSLILEAAERTKVPAGGVLAVDRTQFAAYITDKICQHPLIAVEHALVEHVPEPPAVIATGPLTDGALAQDIAALTGQEALSFYDAAAPIVTRDSIDMEKAYRKSRYDRGDGDDYINCPMNAQQYEQFVRELVNAQTAPVHGFEETKLFEGCMPVESMARRGFQTLAFGPLKPIGLEDPRTGKLPYAVVQLRQDDAMASMYNLVGFQTRLKFPEQKRVFSMIPGLERAEFVRYGVMHRNTYLRSPGFLNAHFEVIARPGLYFAGQITGVEGYVESAASGLVAGIALAAQLAGKQPPDFTAKTVLGGLGAYISAPHSRFDPMNANFSIVEPMPGRFKNKKLRYEAYAQRSLAHIRSLI